MIGTPEDIAALRLTGARVFTHFHIDLRESTTSTQDVVRAAAVAGAGPGYVCIADVQTGGRGRQGRRWEAPPGTSLLASVLVRAPMARLGWIPIVAGLGLRAAISALSGYEAALKWPNDVLAGSNKLAGVLAEVEGRAPAGDGVAVVVGVGANLRVPAFPAGVRGASLHSVSSRVPCAAALLGVFLAELAGRLDDLAGHGPDAAAQEWSSHAAGLGAPVTVSGSPTPLHGIAVGLDHDGALLVRHDGRTTRVLAGDVHIGLPPAG